MADHAAASLFGRRGRGQEDEQRRLLGRSPQPPPRDVRDAQMDGYGRPQPPPRDMRDTQMDGYGPPQPQFRQQGMPQRRPVENYQPHEQEEMMGERKQLRLAKVQDKTLADRYIFGNL